MDKLDIILINRLRAREEEAFKILFDRYYNDLLAFSCHYLWDHETAEDLVQDVFVKLYEAGETIQVATSLKAYLFKAVRNRCLNHLRNLQVRDTHHQCMIDAQLWTDIIDFSDEVDRYHDKAVVDFLWSVIERLPERSREIVRMRLEKEYKFSEIAALLNITENHAKVQMSRSVRFIREEFKRRKV